MARFAVTTALTAYTTYEVEADSEEEAAEMVANSETRAELLQQEALPYRENGYGDDESVIDIQEIS